jgi:hypothetical protein
MFRRFFISGSSSVLSLYVETFLTSAMLHVALQAPAIRNIAEGRKVSKYKERTDDDSEIKKGRNMLSYTN